MKLTIAPELPHEDKVLLAEVINLASLQLKEGFQSGAFYETLAKHRSHVPPLRFGSVLRAGFPEIPTGPILRSFTRISKASGGMYGLWAVAGEPKIGKSTFAFQVALNYASSGDVILYDYENGPARLGYRLGRIFKGNIRKARRATERVLFKRNAVNIEADLQKIKPPALIIVDQIQKLPSSVKHRRESIDRWILRFEAIVQEGYAVLLISEKSRAQYDKISLGGFKESSEIEYSATFGLQLRENRDDQTKLDVHIVANRDREDRGCITTLRRDGWVFREEDPDALEDRRVLD